MLSAESFTRLTALQRLLIWVLGACLTGMLGYALFYVPARADLIAATNELEAARSRQRQVEDELQRQHALVEVIDRDETKLAAALATTPGADGRAHDLLFIAPELARRTELQIERWQPLPDEPVAGWGVRSPVQVHARATWPAFLAFVRGLSQLSETVVLDELVVRWGSDGAAALEISFRLGLLRVRPELAQPAAQPVVRASAPGPTAGPERPDPFDR